MVESHSVETPSCANFLAFSEPRALSGSLGAFGREALNVREYDPAVIPCGGKDGKNTLVKWERITVNTIRAWLGHVSLDTTHVYAEVDMEMKAKALARVDISDLKTTLQQRTLLSLMAFSKAL